MSRFSEVEPIIPQEVTLDMAKYKAIAYRLHDEHEAEIWRDDEEGIRNAREGWVNGKSDIDHVLATIPNDVLRHYAGHGVVRDVLAGNVAVGLSIIENNIILGDIAPLHTVGYLSAYTSGDFFVISLKGGFKGPGPNGGPQRISVELSEGVQKKKAGGIKIEPGAFVCNLSIDSLVEPLRQMYPGKKILHAAELTDYINEQERAV